MKLPKPGNVKLPKPGKVKLPKPGKMPGNLKLPAFHLKSGFLKKNLITLIAAAVLIIGTGTAYGTLATRDADRGFDPIEGVNQDRYQVLVSGEGYKLTKIQERNYKLQKKQNEVNAAQAAQNATNNPTTIRTTSGYRTYRTSNYRYRYRGSSSNSSTGTVFISTNIYSQKSAKTSWNTGDEFSFIVTAYIYKNGKRDTLSKDEIKVKADKGTLKHTKSKDGNQYYTLKLGTGMNKITITAKDKKSKKKTENTYTIYAGRSSSESTDPTTKPTNTDPTKPKEEVQKVSFGFGTLDTSKMAITDSTTAYDVLKKTNGVELNDDKDVLSVTGDMSAFSLDDYDQDVLKEKFLEDEGISLKTKEEIDKEIRSDEELRNNISEDIIKQLAKDNNISEEDVLPDYQDEFDQMLEDALKEQVEAEYKSYTESIDKKFKKWKDDIEKIVKNEKKISRGYEVNGLKFKWTYTKSAKGKNVLSDLKLRLVLE